MQVQTIGSEQMRQIERAKAVKKRLYAGQSVEKAKIYQLEQKVEVLQMKVAQAAEQANEAAMIHIRDLETELSDLKETHKKLLVQLKKMGMEKLVQGAMMEIEDQAKTVPSSAIVHAVSLVSKITTRERHGICRQRRLVFWRSVEAWILKQRTRRSYPEIAQVVGGRDHSTIIHHVQKVAGNYEHYRKAIDAVEALL